MELTHIESNQQLKSTSRNTLTFTEAWEQVFECTVSKDKLYSEVRAGRVPHAKIGTKILFRRDTLNAWFQQQEYENLRTNKN
jgi:excisionase family DNA binding protein